MTLRPLPWMRQGSQRGAFGVLYAVMLAVMLGMIGLVVDLSSLYARRHEPQSPADGAALAAARVLDGMPARIIKVRNQARRAAIQAKHRLLNAENLSSGNGAPHLAAGPEGHCIEADAATGSAPGALHYVRVDSGGLQYMYSAAVAIARLLSVDQAQSVVRRAVAGRKDSAPRIARPVFASCGRACAPLPAAMLTTTSLSAPISPPAPL